MRKIVHEVLAGLSTFFTAAYLLLLYPKILSEGGIDFGSALTAMVLTIVITTCFSAFYTNFPVLLSPGLSVGPFLVYSLILKEGAPWQTIFGIVFWGGFFLFLLSILKVRQAILLHLPPAIRSAVIGGIGLFLICIGLKELGVLHPPFFTISQGIALLGLFLLFLLYYFKIPGSFLTAVLSCWVLALPFGLVEWHGVVALPPPLSPTFLQLDFWTPFEFEWWGALLSVLLISLFDTSASLSVLSKLAGRINEKGEIQQIDRIVIPDGLGSMFGSLLGTGTLTFTLESSAGVKVGGRTKITALTAACCCLLALFFYPLISSIPLFAMVPPLLAIGIFMAQEIRTIPWGRWTESIPALFVLFTIPITLSIYLGFALGFVSYTLLKALNGEWREVHPVCRILAIVFAVHLSWGFYVRG